jgi:hypothetical protein
MSSGKFLSFIFLVFLGGAMMPSAYGQNTPALNINIPAMMEEVKAYILSENVKTDDDITEIVERHIPVGASEEDVIQAFKAAGFSLKDDTEKDYNRHDRNKYDKFLRFRADFSLFPKFMWGHIIGVSVNFKNGQTVFRGGQVFYDSPILKFLP